MITKKYPIKLRAVPKEILWGGDKLRRTYGKKAPFNKNAESWELTVRNDGMSVIDGGEYDGMTLEEYVSLDFSGIVGLAADQSVFPLLIKFIDAADDLSVQVHPDNEYALKHEGECGKTEMWYIIQADEGAEIIYGLNSKTTRTLFKEAILKEKTSKVLKRVPIHAGDVYFIPSGQVHAICKGALLAEIQQNSNVTYRIYDYGRTDINGKKRELHINKALDSVRLYTDNDIHTLQFEGSCKRQSLPISASVLCNCKYFRVSSFDLKGKLHLNADEKSFLSLLFTEPSSVAEISSCGVTVNAKGGDSIFIPAGCGEVTVAGHGGFLLSEI